MNAWLYVNSGSGGALGGKILSQTEACTVYRIKNDTENGIATMYHVFPGIKLLYNELRMTEFTGYSVKQFAGAEDVMENRNIIRNAYDAPDMVKESYIKLKVMERLLFISRVEPEASVDRQRYFDMTRGDTVRAMRDFMIEHMDRKFTLDELNYPNNSISRLHR